MTKYLLRVCLTVFVIVLMASTTSLYAAEKPIELRLSTFIPPNAIGMTEVFNPWIKEIEQRTNGRVKIHVFAGGALGAPKDQYDMVVRGAVDIAMATPAYTPGRFPLTDVLSLPIPFASSEVGSRVMWELYEKHLKKEYSEVKLLMLIAAPPHQINTSKKPVKTLADLKGLRIKTSTPSMMSALKAFGASGLNIPLADAYDALQKGMVDGILIDMSAMKDWRLAEVTKYHTVIDTFSSAPFLAMNLKTWNSLPADIQKVIDELSGVKLSMKQGQVFDKYAASVQEEIRKQGHQIIYLSEADKAAWREKMKPIIADWIADMEKKGLPGKEVYESAVSLLAKYSK